ncbi:4Fe-4S dicluster domain-containing protein [Aureimonas leprariae]|uniref:4Fe-4S dicluster domain-containing protein n=1 Tax=Plantimonas leprariae TaxID=2615207 RepID=A0A7V7PTI7_9HYPH|nr:4Fe-4S dicluster domain-containing protein [Aureimonas leprariae]
MPDVSGAAPLNRREALRLVALALAVGATGCKPAEDIVPAVRSNGLAAGEPLRFATSLPLGGYGRGMLATSVEGRPIKVSGNPLHPASLGSTDLFAEADILGLYDPDRSRTPTRNGLIANWDGFLAELGPRRAALAARRGEGLAILAGRITSPTLRRQFDALHTAWPAMRLYRHEPVDDANGRAGSKLAFGRPLDVLPDLARADVVLCLGADPHGAGPAQLRNAAGFAKRRTVREGTGAMQRLYVAESAASLTGLAADHRLPLAPAALLDFAAGLAARFGGPATERPVDGRFLDALAADLRGAGAKALVLVGEEQPPELHALGHWLNAALGAFGSTLDLVEPADAPSDGDLGALAAELAAGRVDTLLILGTNPAYDGPSDLGFADLIGKAAFTVHLGTHRDETGALCRWHLAETHPLEGWSDLRAVDGTAGIVQPLIQPLYASVGAHELLAALAGDGGAKPYDLVRQTWSPGVPAAEFEDWWLGVVEDGVVPGSAAAPVAPPRQPTLSAPPASGGGGLALVLRPDPTIYDGRYGNNAWAQECPKPVTHETWGNALHLHPDDAARLGIAADDAVRIEAGGPSVEAPVVLDRRQAEGAASLTLGYGRTRPGAIGIGLGANAYALRRTDALWTLPDVRLTAVGKAEPMPLTQATLDEDGRDLAPEMRLADLAAGVRLKPKAAEPAATFYAAQPHEAPYGDGSEPRAWAMVIDTTLCIGCNACVVACQAENNVPVVGPDEIRAGRTMHWLRIDAYEKDDGAGAVFQPVPCMHCEKAPCEPVCPVGASVHDDEGLNVQVYNRCVGTRFCQANCPYKVRRFNFFGYANGQEYSNLGNPPLAARFNPDVTVRGRGVMEKCTYCVQRIAGARQRAEAEGRPMRDGDAVTACQSACPTSAIRFGNLAAAGAEVAKLREEPQHYALLEELGTKPRTTYLAKVRNPNPALEGERS